MMAASKSVVSAADRTAMTTNSVPCRIRMLPKVHRLPSNKSKNTTTAGGWKNPKKTKAPTTTAETPVKKTAPPTIRRISTPTTVASSPSASVEKSNSSPSFQEVAPAAVVRKECAITSIPKVHKRVRAPPPAQPEILDLPIQEISFVHSEGDEAAVNDVAKELMFGEDEGFEGFVNDSINREELEDFSDDQFLRRNQANSSPQTGVSSSMETELRRNREKLNSSFPEAQNNSIIFEEGPTTNELSFETTSSMAVGERLPLSHLSPIRSKPRRQVVGEETIMDTSREVEMVRNSFFDNEELPEEFQEEKKVEIPKEISLVTLSAAVVDQSDFVSPLQRLRSSQSLGQRDEDKAPMDKHKLAKATRKANVIKHLTAERKKQEAAAAEAKKKEEQAAKLAAQAKKQVAAAKKKTKTSVKARQEPKVAKKQVEQPKKKQAEKKPLNKSTSSSPQAFTEKPPRPSSPQTITSSGSSFVPEWANKSLRKTTTGSSVSSSVAPSCSESVTSSSNKVVPEWANKQLRKSTASVTSIGTTNSVSEELSSWMGKRRRASEQ